MPPLVISPSIYPNFVFLLQASACFSKLLPGLFKKAAELRNLGVEVAIILFSPSGTPFFYDHPSTFEALDCFLNDGAATFETSPSADDRSGQIKRDLEYWGGLLEAQKKLRRQMKAVLKDPRSRPHSFWWDADISSMSLPELKEYRRILQRSRFHLALAEQRLRFSEPLEEIEKPVAIAGTPETGSVWLSAGGICSRFSEQKLQNGAPVNPPDFQ
ncbi:hypothetical protein KSP40_PGU012136 [Platanthera guangdongensis]|uniref:MADS-box domain-containing protein n=1 Tax=Platanthera guangdongensis TaxID=2320717 RepID=A0ABR2MV27_9ASPA